MLKRTQVLGIKYISLVSGGFGRNRLNLFIMFTWAVKFAILACLNTHHSSNLLDIIVLYSYKVQYFSKLNNSLQLHYQCLSPGMEIHARESNGRASEPAPCWRSDIGGPNIKGELA